MPFRKSKPWGRTKPPAGARLDFGDPLALGLAGCWLFNGAGGLVVDSVQRNNGTLSAATRVPGVFGGALKFNGTSAYVAITNIVFAGPFSLNLWYYNTDLAGTRMLVATNTSVISNCKVGFVSSKHFVRILNAGGSDNTVAAVGNVWQMLTVTRDRADKIDLYVNGGPANRLFADAAQTGNFNLGYFGADDPINEATQFFQGSIDHIKAWNRQLKAAEVSALYTEPFRFIVAPRRRIISLAAVPITGTATSSQGSQSVAAAAVTGTGGDGSSGQGSQSVDAAGSTTLAFAGATESGQGGQTIDASALLQFMDVGAGAITGTATSGQGAQSVAAAALLQFLDVGVTNITGTAQSGQGQTSDAVGAVPVVEESTGRLWVAPIRARPLAISGRAVSGQGGQTVTAIGNVVSIRTLKRAQNNRRAVLAALLLAA